MRQASFLGRFPDRIRCTLPKGANSLPRGKTLTEAYQTHGDVMLGWDGKSRLNLFHENLLQVFVSYIQYPF